MNNLKRFLILMFLVMAFTSCISANPQKAQPVYPFAANGVYGVSRYIDKEAGVVCWVFEEMNKGGIACLPIKDTKLTDMAR